MTSLERVGAILYPLHHVASLRGFEGLDAVRAHELKLRFTGAALPHAINVLEWFVANPDLDASRLFVVRHAREDIHAYARALLQLLRTSAKEGWEARDVTTIAKKIDRGWYALGQALREERVPPEVQLEDVQRARKQLRRMLYEGAAIVEPTVDREEAVALRRLVESWPRNWGVASLVLDALVAYLQFLTWMPSGPNSAG